jgi:sugar lactone lactonase YvrE
MVLVLGVGVARASDEAASLRDHYQKAVAAYQAKDYPTFLTHSQKAAELAPAHPYLVYRLACAQALNGQPAEAIQTLERLAALGVHRAVAEDPDLAGVTGHPDLEALLGRLEELNRPIGESQVAFVVDEPDLIPEGIAHHAENGVFFVSSVHKRKIVRVDREGSATDFVAPETGLWATLGIAVDAERGALWAVTEAIPHMRGFTKEEQGRTALVRFDLETGREVARHLPPPGDEPHSFNDLTVDSKGAVLVSDPRARVVYTLSPGGEALKPLTEPGAVLSPQGLALSADETAVFVSDYARSSGVVRINRASGEVTAMSVPEAPTLYGIDGLMRFGQDLIAIQNGIRPHRVLRLRLDDSGEAVTDVTILERSNPRFDEPTLGVIVGETLYYVANSQWGRFEEDGTIWPLDKLDAPVILKLPLAR